MTNLIIAYSLYIGLALGLALAVVASSAVALDMGTRIRTEPLPLVFFAILVVIMASPLATGRVLAAGLATDEASLEDIGSALWVNRIATLGVLALCGERIARYFLKKGPPLAGTALLFAFFAFSAANLLLNGAFGAKPAFDHKWLYGFFLYFAFFLVAQDQPERCLRLARWALLMFLAGSALAVLFRPNAVVERGYAGLFGLNFRYYGLATHANTMGPLAMCMLVLLWKFPFRPRVLNLAAAALAAGSLLLSQSKTTILIAVAAFAFLALYRNYQTVASKTPGASVKFALVLWAALCVASAALALGVLFGINYFDWALAKLDTVTGGQVSSLSGRTQIWALAWREFMNHPVFGYGPTIWDPVYRFYAQMPFAPHAHNQLLQSLSSAGAVGGLALVVYAGTLAVFALRACAASGGISVALVGLMLARCISEVPFGTAGVLQSEFFIQLVALVACVGFMPKEALGKHSRLGQRGLRLPASGRMAPGETS